MTLATPTTVSPVRAVSVRQVPTGAKYGTRREAAVYEARARQDGVVTWRCVKQYNTGGWTKAAAERRGEALAERLGLPFVFGLRHGRVVR